MFLSIFLSLSSPLSVLCLSRPVRGSRQDDGRHSGADDADFEWSARPNSFRVMRVLRHTVNGPRPKQTIPSYLYRELIGQVVMVIVITIPCVPKRMFADPLRSNSVAWKSFSASKTV